LERWSKYLFTPKGEKKDVSGSPVESNYKHKHDKDKDQYEHKQKARTGLGTSDDEEESENGFALIDDLELGPGGRGEAENGSGSKVYTRSFWTRDLAGQPGSGSGSTSSSSLIELHPDPSTALRVWDCIGVGSAGAHGAGDVKGSVIWETAPREIVSWVAQRGKWVLDAAFVWKGDGLKMVRL
jgi:hypothetical protein